MEINEIKKLANDYVGCRIRLYLKNKDSPVVVRDSSKVTISNNCIELTSHGYDEDNEMVGDDNYGYCVSGIEKVEFVRKAETHEMGALQINGGG